MPTVAKAIVSDNTETLTFDWDTIKQEELWNNTQPGGSFALGEGIVDIDFELGTGIQFASFGSSGLTPAISDTLNGSKGADDQSLHIQIDTDKAPNAIELANGDYSMKMVTSFLGYDHPVTDVSFMLYDIDIIQNSWQDRVVLKGYLGDQVVNPIFNFLYPEKGTIQTVDAYTLDGFKTVDNNADFSNVLVSFAGPIDRFELIFTDGDDVTKTNPNNHGIGIGDLSFTAVKALPKTQHVPEPTTIFGLMTFGALSVSSVRKRKHQLAK